MAFPREWEWQSTNVSKPEEESVILGKRNSVRRESPLSSKIKIRFPEKLDFTD